MLHLKSINSLRNIMKSEKKAPRNWVVRALVITKKAQSRHADKKHPTRAQSKNAIQKSDKTSDFFVFCND